MNKGLIAILLTLMLPILGKGQDLQFSQFFAAPLHLNPALTGATELTRMGANYRKQWPGLNYDFHGYAAYFDHYSFDLNSGFGASLHAFEESNLRVRLTEFSLYYAYKVQVTEGLTWRLGAQGGIARRHAGLDHLLLSDQIDVFSKSVAPVTSEELPDFEPYNYWDLGVGTLLMGNRYWLGASAYHLNQPFLSFYSSHLGDRMDIKFNVHGGYQIPLSGNTSVFDDEGSDFLIFAANYKQQGPFRQLDLSTQVVYQSVLVGLGVRGIPGTGDLPNRDSVIALLGFSLEGGLMIGYSFDFMISRLGMETHGAHEISIRYQFLQGLEKDRNRKSRVLKCFRYMM